jgi:hypothetical protein
MALRWDLDIAGGPAAQERSREMGDRAMTPLPALKLSAEIIKRGLERNFETRGQYLGRPWPALAAGTLEQRAEAGSGSDPLVVTSALKASLTGGKGSVEKYTPFSVRVGTSDWKARLHQGQSDRMPMRKLVGITGRDAGLILATIRRYIVDGRTIGTGGFL